MMFRAHQKVRVWLKFWPTIPEPYFDGTIENSHDAGLDLKVDRKVKFIPLNNVAWIDPLD